MITGNDVLDDINRRYRKQEGRVADAESVLAKLAARLRGVSADLTRARAKFATIRREAFERNEIDGFDAVVDGRMESAYEEIAKVQQKLEGELEGARGGVDAAESALETIQARLFPLQEKLEGKESELSGLLAADEKYQALSADAKEAISQAKAHRARQSRAAAEKDEKAKAYEADPLFMYLHERGYATADYRAMPFVRYMDGFVAKVVGFGRASQNYNLLQQLPVFLSRRTAQFETKAQRMVEQVEQHIVALRNKHGLTDLEKDITTVEVQRRDGERDLEAAADRLEAIESELERIGDGTHPACEALMRDLDSLAASSTIDKLKALAAQTENPEDDVIVREMELLRAEREELQSRRQGEKRRLDSEKERLDELKRVRSRFKSAGYDSHRYRFDRYNENDLDSFLAGAMTEALLWSAIDRGASRVVSSGSSGGDWDTFDSGGSTIGSFGGGLSSTVDSIGSSVFDTIDSF